MSHHFENTGPARAPYLQVTCLYCGEVDVRTETVLDPKDPQPLTARLVRQIPADAVCPGRPLGG